MPTNADQTDLSQPSGDELSTIASTERKKLAARNDYFISNQYSSTNKNAMADGDTQGKGTGKYLDVYNQDAGSSLDVAERKSEIKINEYQPNKPYQAPR
jgi:hypothetical protein